MRFDEKLSEKKVSGRSAISKKESETSVYAESFSVKIDLVSAIFSFFFIFLQVYSVSFF